MTIRKYEYGYNYITPEYENILNEIIKINNILKPSHCKICLDRIQKHIYKFNHYLPYCVVCFNRNISLCDI